MKPKLKVFKLHEDAIIPKYQTSGAAGFDIHSIEEVVIKPGETKLIKTGLAFSLEKNQTILVCSRSGLAINNSVFTLNAPGIVDSDYRGGICGIMHNASNTDFIVKKHDRIAQAIVMDIPQYEIEEVSELDETERGENGFGSTGV